MRVTISNVDEENWTSNGKAITELIFEIFFSNGRLIRVGDRLSGEFGLTSARWQVLGAILDRPATVAQIGRRFELSRQSVLWVVQALRKDDLVALLHNPDHKRSKLVSLTPKGSAAVQGVLQSQHRWSDDLGSHFTHAELERCSATLSRLNELLGNFVEDDDGSKT